MLGEEKPGDHRPPDTDSVEIKSKDEALSFLFRRLWAANRLFVEKKDSGRRGVIEAINVVTQFLKFFEGTTDHCQPLTALSNALLSLEEGDVLALLAPAHRASRPPNSAARACDKAMAVATVHWLCETGLDPNSARKMVAHACREAGIKPSRKGAKDSQGQEPEITDRTVRGWGEKIAEDPHSQAAQTFDRLKQSWAAKTKFITHQAIKSVGVDAVRRGLLEDLRSVLAEMRAVEH
jgi:hypothetical protein